MKTFSPASGVDAQDGVRVAYRTQQGLMLVGRIEEALSKPSLSALRGKVNLVFTSPPFPLVNKKRYGNESGDKYVSWLKGLAPRLADLLTPDGSIVIELGNAWVKGSPLMSTLPIEALLSFKNAASLCLCQHIICHNPARLPSPAAWVNVQRIRLKDSYTHVWWMSKTEFPKADNKKVLMPYSNDMKKLLESKKYNSGRRPSGHVISDVGFLTNHGGSISANVLELSADASRIPGSLLKFSGTAWDATYRQYCADHGLELHPARMQTDLAMFFIQFLTDPGDLVVDPFAGSNTTGAASELLARRWVSVEAKEEYVEGSKGRFQDFSSK
jgi:DNA modification methylase